MRSIVAVVLPFAVAACSSGLTSPGRRKTASHAPVGCASTADCTAGMMCLEGLCVQAPPSAGSGDAPAAHLTITPTNLDFGRVDVGTARRLALNLDNDGAAMLTLGRVDITPADQGFVVAPLGTGPFWIRPGESRQIFVIYRPTAAQPSQASLRVESQAAAVTIALLGE